MRITGVQALAPIVKDTAASARFYGETLGLPLEGEPGTYQFTSAVPGLDHLGLWCLSDAARSCFDADSWPADLPEPQICVELAVADVDEAIAELRGAGCTLLGEPETQEWGTTVIRLLSPEGFVLVIGHTPDSSA
jgi:catechol 2,3-dioxygenase-like lactoylglutathione lyase family enzyme